MNQIIDNWLTTLCCTIKGVKYAGVFTIEPGTSSCLPIVFWPEENYDIISFSVVLEAVLSEKKIVLQQQKNENIESGAPLDIIACPLFVDKQFYGVVVVAMPSQVHLKQQTVILQIKAASVWFEPLIKQCSLIQKRGLVTIVELVASCLEHDRFQAAATEVMTDLANRFSCDRISIGFLHRTGVTVEAVSYSAGFDRKSSLIRAIGAAMDEAVDQDCTIVYPATADSVFLTRFHTALAGDHKAGMILTIPFAVSGMIAGAILMERPSDNPFDPKTVDYLGQVVSMIGPVLDVRRSDERPLFQRIRRSFNRLTVKLFGVDSMGLKLSVISLALCLVFSVFAKGDYRITGDAQLTALIQRVIVASQNGFIAEASARPGDIIHKGEILGTLDDKDLELEHKKWSSQLEQLKTEYRDALARHDRSKVAIIRAKKLQTEAQLNLVREQLNRIRFTAPFDGFIVSGDLSQSLGSPVERGQILFTVTPLDTYRVILKIDEHDIANVIEGQRGTLVLSGIPEKPMQFTVKKITPVSIAEAGHNFFQVEAEMENNSDMLRPGMEGITKIDIDRRKMIWIWTHKLVDWWRLFLWTYGP